MIRLVMESIRPTIEAIPWVERYGGLTYALAVQEETGPDTFENKVVPFSDYVTTRDCHEEKDRYFYLTPDDSKKSIVYFEQVGDTVFSNLARGGARLRGVLSAQQNFRLVAWVNLNLVGSGLERDGGLMAAELWAAVDGLRIPALDPVEELPVTNIKWQINSEIAKSLNIFQSYSYNDKGAFLMYPFEFFAFNVQANFYIKKGCITTYTPDTEICIDQDVPVVLAGFDGDTLGGFDGDDLSPFPN